MWRRSIAYVWVSLALFILVLCVVLRIFVLQSFADLEHQNTVKNVGRVVDLIADREMSMNAKAADWAQWDDAYQFVQDGNSHFIRSNFALSAFVGFNLNLIVYVHGTGEIAYGRWHNSGERGMVPLPAEVRQIIDRGPPLTGHQDVQGSISGIVMLKQGPMLVASRPVVTSNVEGPIRGTLIFGQLFGPEEEQSISRVTRVRMLVRRLDVGNLPTDFVQVRKRITKSGDVIVEPLSKRVVAGYTILDDIYGQPALMLRVVMPRSIYNRGLALSQYALGGLVLLSVLFGSVVSLLMLRTVKQEIECDRKTIEFYRRTITAATNGKVMVTDRSEIEKLGGAPIAQWKVRLPTDLAPIREKVMETATGLGFDRDRALTFVTGVGEAVTNAIKHAGGGKASLHHIPGGLLFISEDQGLGIPVLTIPDVALLRGYSTAGTLGMGYKIMVTFGDRVYLATGSEGTTVAIEMRLQPAESSMADLESENSSD